MMTMRVNGLLRKRQHPVKRARLMMSIRANGLLRKSGTLQWHSPVARSRVTPPWHAPVASSRAMHLRGFLCHQVRNPSKKHIYQRATVKDLKINLLGKIKQNGQRL